MGEINKENPLHISWHDSAWIPHLNPTNVLDYFCEKSNPFYDKSCNNELIKMQRLPMDHLLSMTGFEYTLLHVQEPILYLIRKQYRQGPNHVTPSADYYILAGVVYQAPNLSSVLRSRVATSVHNLQLAFKEFHDLKKFQPSTGYVWSFKEKQARQLRQRHGDGQSICDLEASAARRKQKLEEQYTKFHEMKVDPVLKMLDDAIQRSNKAAAAAAAASSQQQLQQLQQQQQQQQQQHSNSDT